MKQAAFYTSTGRKGAPVQLPKELFGEKENAALLAQAVRVYQWHEHPGRGRTKTRGEVSFSTAKIYRQKGTGRARHGSRSAPIFVHGGIVHGPRGVRRDMKISRRLARLGLAVALSTLLKENRVYFVDVGEIEPKTQVVQLLLTKAAVGSGALVLHGGEQQFVQAAGNLASIRLLRAEQANAYEVVRARAVVITKAGLAALTKTFIEQKGEQ